MVLADSCMGSILAKFQFFLSLVTNASKKQRLGNIVRLILLFLSILTLNCATQSTDILFSVRTDGDTTKAGRYRVGMPGRNGSYPAKGLFMLI